MKVTLKKWWWGLLLVPVLALSSFMIWAKTPLGPMPEALVAMQPSPHVDVETSPWFIFRPIEQPPTTGLILYPGGRVDPRSYAPTAHAIASYGFLVVVVPMPLNLAVFAPDRATDVIAAFPEIHYWVIGGHSLGGAMGSSFARNNPTHVQGLVLWASYPASNDDLSTQDLSVVSVYATLDGLATRDKIEASRSLLPNNTHWIEIAGGNHAQFGWYGDQPGDNPAAISREAQQEQIVQATVNLLAEITQ